MSFNAIDYINTPRWQHSRLGLERIRELLERLGRPQDRLRFVHVAGTNGKGSTCAYVSSILCAAGFRTGLFTSPYVEAFHERIRVDGENISDGDLEAATLQVKEHAEAMEAETGEHPTEFELMTAVALVHFVRSGCDIAVLEVGLGGRLDSTNAIGAPEVAAIARIALDHTDLLGSTLEAIAAEKAGIVKAGSSVVSWPQEPEAMRVVERAAADAGCSLRVPDFSRLSVGEVERADGMAARTFSYGAFKGLRTRLLGSYQPGNAALAIEIALALRDRGWSIPDGAVRVGVESAVWSGRFEVVAQPAGASALVVDGGHNPQGAHVLAESLRDVFPGVRPVFLVSVLADKDYESMLAEVAGLAGAVVCATPPNPRALAAGDLAECARRALRACGRAVAEPGVGAGMPVGGASEAGASAPACADGAAETAEPVVVEAAESFGAAAARARELAGSNGLICAFGSLYSLADVKRAFGA